MHGEASVVRYRINSAGRELVARAELPEAAAVGLEERVDIHDLGLERIEDVDAAVDEIGEEPGDIGFRERCYAAFQTENAREQAVEPGFTGRFNIPENHFL